jgi:hypothetical protein
MATPRKKKVAVETTEPIETPVETPVEVATEELTAKKELKALMEHLRVNAPVEYAQREQELLEELNKL